MAAIEGVPPASSGIMRVISRRLWGRVSRLSTQLWCIYVRIHFFVELRRNEWVAWGRFGPIRDLYVETPTNPLCGLADLSALGELSSAAHHAGSWITHSESYHAAPYTELGVRILLCTRELNILTGMRLDALGAAILTRQGDAEKILLRARLAGAALLQWTVFLVRAGLKTRAFRMLQQMHMAFAVGSILYAHPKI